MSALLPPTDNDSQIEDTKGPNCIVLRKTVNKNKKKTPQFTQHGQNILETY